MMKKYSYEFKARAVEKALGRDPDVSLRSVAIHLGVDHSTLRRWVNQFENQSYGEGIMNEEKSPRLWTAEQKLEIVMACESMDKEQISAHCREHGVYPHHVKQWKAGDPEINVDLGEIPEFGSGKAAQRGEQVPQEGASPKGEGACRSRGAAGA